MNITSRARGFRNKTVTLKNSNRKTSSNKWLSRQLNDQFVVKAKIEGYRSRAAYKLIEIHQKFKLFNPGSKVIDLGAAPGGWSQIAAKLTKADTHESTKIIALDLLEMESLPGVTFIQKNFLDEDAPATLIELLHGSKADIVLSDMAANTTGHTATDHIKIMVLCEQAYDFALTVLKPGGHFVAKIFRGGAENELLSKIKTSFTTVKHFKPDSSRKESSEFYLVALGKKL